MTEGGSVDLHHLRTADSTNIIARGMAEEGAAHGTLVVADRQVSGKGRLGRIWEDGGLGNCMASLILRPSLSPKDAPLICMAAAVSIQKNCGDLIGVKWPNDLLGPDGCKVGGILAEMELLRGEVEFLVVGFGVNLASAPNHVKAANHLQAYGIHVDRMVFAKACAIEMMAWSECLPLRTDALLEQWRAVDRTLGRTVSVGATVGTAVDVDRDGSLLLKDKSGALKVIRAGDVTMVPEL